MNKLFSYPGTLPAYASPKTRKVTALIDNVQLLLEEGSRSINAGDEVLLTAYEFGLIDADTFTNDILIADTETLNVVTPIYPLEDIADGIVFTWVATFDGDLTSWSAKAIAAATTALKTSTLELQIDGVAVTGSSFAITSANMTPINNVVAGGTISAADAFLVGDVITVVASSTTAFVEGDVQITIVTTATNV